ncbi:MAG: serine hydrolase [Bacteroidota bacterium]
MKPLISIFIVIATLSPALVSQQLPDELVAKLTDNTTYPNIDGILVSRNNELLIEAYFNGFGRDSLHETRSAHKSIISLLAGIAVDQGLFEVTDKVKTFIPEWRGDARGDITIKDLLEMKSGLECEGFFDVGPDCESEMYEKKDWLGYLLDIPLRYEPGLYWEYSSMEPDLMALIITRASNMTIMDFADQYLLGPLGIEDLQWYITPDGRGYGGGSAYMKPLDMLTLAELVLNKGTWKGEQLISERWIDESTTCQTLVEMSFLGIVGTEDATFSDSRYGYFWYREVLNYKGIDTEVLFASGNGGQYLMILEDYDAAIAFTGSNYSNWRGKYPFEILIRYIIPILEES